MVGSERRNQSLLNLAEDRFPGQQFLVLNGAKGEILASTWSVPGWEEEPPQENSLYDFVLLDQKKPLKQVLSHVQDKGQPQTCELAITDGGATSWWSARVEPLQPKGRSQHLLLLGTEITTHKMGENQDRITIPGQIANQLFNLLIQEGFFEVILDDKEDLYHASLLEFPLTDPSQGVQRLVKHHLIPGAYLMDGRHLFLTPLQPSFGNIQLRRAQSIKLRFYEDLHALETTVELLGVFRSEERAALSFSFPKILHRVGVRGCRRVKVPFGLSLRVTIFPTEGDPFEGMVDDVSAEGMAFLYPDKVEPVPVWEFVRINLRTPDGAQIPLRAEVCSLQKTQDRSDVAAAPRQRCGLRFVSPDYDAEKALQKLVERIEKRLHQVLMQKRKKLDTLLDDM